jgi:hypothetical protein
MRRLTRLRYQLISAVLVAGIGSCDTDGLYDHELTIRKTVELTTGLAFLEGYPGRVVFLEVGQNSVRVRQVLEPDEGERLVWLTGGPVRSAPTKLFAMAVPQDERETGIPRTLIRIDPIAGTVDRFIAASEFGGLAFAPGGTFAVLYHLDSDGDDTGELYNPNEVAVVDLTQPPSLDNPKILSIDIGGRAVTGVDFVPAMEIDGTMRSLAVFYAEGMVKLVDLRDLEIPAIAIKLTADDDPRDVEPKQVVARPADEMRDPMLFVRATESEDIYAISLVPRPDGLPGFWASLNQYDGGPRPSDLLLIEDGDTPLLLVANSWGTEANVINIDTADSFALQLDGSGSQALLRGDPSALEVVLYGVSTNRVHFVAVDGLAEEQDGNLEDLLIPDGVDQASELGQDRLLITPWSSGDLLVLDMAERDILRLTAPAGYDWQEADIFGNVFFVATTGSDRVVSLDLTTGHPESLVLDEPVSSFHVFSGAGMGLVIHPSPTGRATLFPLDSASRETAVVIDGFWLEGFLDDTEVQ